MKKQFLIILTAALAASSLSAISVSADELGSSSPAYTVTEADYAVWAEYGVSAAELDAMLAATSPTYIKDFVYYADCSYYQNGTTFEINTIYDPSTVSFMGADVLPNVSGSSSSTSNYGSNKKFTVSGTIVGTGDLYRFKFTRSDLSATINSTTNQCILSTWVQYTFGYANITVHNDYNGLIWIGDVNQDAVVDISDVMMITSFVSGSTSTIISDAGMLAADCNFDGNVDLDDALLIQQYCARQTDHVWG